MLTELAQSKQPLGVRELARRLAIDRSTVQRCLTTLKSRGFVRQDARSRGYELGYASRALAASIATTDDLIAASEGPMRALAAAAGETICLNVREDGWRVLLFQVESDQPLRYSIKLGQRYPLHCGAASKVLVAFLPEEEFAALRGEIDSNWKSLTQATPASWRQFERALAEIRANGYAVTRGETVAGVVGIAAPVRDASGRVLAALGVYGPEIRLGPTRVRQLIPRVKKAASEISMALGAQAQRPGKAVKRELLYAEA